MCNKCGKGFFRAEGHCRHVECHSEEKKMKCTVKECPQLFTLRLAIKAHIKLKHSGVKDRIKCKFADKGCEKTFTVKGNMVEHTFKCKFNPDGVQEMKCKVCGKRRLLYAKAHITTQKEKPMDGISKMTVLE